RSVRATREAGEEDLVETGRRRLKSFLRHGVTTVEAKTGYGLSVDAEEALLRAAARLAAEGPQAVVPTFLGAHVVPARVEPPAAGLPGGLRHLPGNLHQPPHGYRGLGSNPGRGRGPAGDRLRLQSRHLLLREHVPDHRAGLPGAWPDARGGAPRRDPGRGAGAAGLSALWVAPPGQALRLESARRRDLPGHPLPIRSQPRDRHDLQRPAGRGLAFVSERLDLVEAVPNFSEGRRQEVLEAISVAAATPGHVLDLDPDPDH